MTWLMVDEQRCTRCGSCVEACPMGLLTLGRSLQGPQGVPGAEAACIDCGHCVAICPHAALTLASTSPDDCPALPKDWRTAPEDLELLLKGRRSIRCFGERTVPREQLQALLEVARYAPTANNGQPIEWLVLSDPKIIQATAAQTIDFVRQQFDPQTADASNGLRHILAMWDRGEDSICRGAPHLVLALTPRGAGGTDAAIALTYLELAAAARGLGVCWDGFVAWAASQWPALPELWGLDADQACAGALMLGYPRHRYQRIPPRRELRVSWR